MPRKRKYKSPERWYKAAMSEIDERQPDYAASIIAMRDQKHFDRAAEGYTEELNGYIKLRFDKAIRILEHSNSTRRLKRGLYYEAAHLERRRAAMLQYLPEAVLRFSDKYPDLNIEHEFICLNTAPCGCNYDGSEKDFTISLAIAIFILDELESAGRMEEAIRYFPTEDEFWGMLRLPHGFHDSRYDNELIGALAFLIRFRHEGESGINVFMDNRTAGWTNERRADIEAAHGTGTVPVADYTNRQRLDAILALLRPEVIERAVKRYVEKMWEFMDSVLWGIRIHRREQIPVCNEILQIVDDIQALKARNGMVAACGSEVQPPEARENIGAGAALKKFLLEKTGGSTYEQLERLLAKSAGMRSARPLRWRS